MPANPRSVKVLVVGGRPLVGQALAAALGSQRGLRSVGAASPLDAMARADRETPDVIVTDTDLPGSEGPELVRDLKEACPGSAILVVADRQSDLALAQSVEAGALGYIYVGQPLDTLAETVRKAAAGERLISPQEARDLLRLLRHRRGERGSARERADRLTRREVEVLQRMADGLPPERIAVLLGMTPATLRTHVQNILTKLGVHSKTEALAFAIRHGKVSARH